LFRVLFILSPMLLPLACGGGNSSPASPGGGNPPTATPTSTPTITASNSPTSTASNSATSTPSASPTLTATVTPSSTPSDSPTLTPTASPTSTPSPTFTPTLAGTRVAFVSNRDGGGNYDIYTMLEDGSNLVRLTSSSDQYFQPRLSADQKKIVYTYITISNHAYIYSMDINGGSVSQLTNGYQDTWPVWSHDGTKIAYTSNQGGTLQVYSMNADGSNQTNLSNDLTHSYVYPAWSPDGTKITYVSYGPAPSYLYVMNSDGSSQAPVTSSSAYGYGHPAWSPDGTKILFSYTQTLVGFATIHPDGSNYVDITGLAGTHQYPIWSADGSKIFFTDTVGGNTDIYSMNANGSGVTNLTNNSALDSFQ
jgi:Tol biopolymer transport system component